MVPVLFRNLCIDLQQSVTLYSSNIQLFALATEDL
jgi:hypothetical protein